MTLSGAIADDKELFESGFVAIHQKDENGRTVLFIDRIRVVPPSATRDPAVRQCGSLLLLTVRLVHEEKKSHLSFFHRSILFLQIATLSFLPDSCIGF